DLARLAVGRVYPHGPVGRARLRERNRERQLLERQRRAVEVRRREAPTPLLRTHRTGLLEAHSQQLARGLVVEDEVALVVDEKGGCCEVGGEAAREDHLDRM